jgi:hypothetical protein
LYAVKVLSASGSGTTAGVISGVDYITNNKNANRKSVAKYDVRGERGREEREGRGRGEKRGWREERGRISQLVCCESVECVW